MTTVEKLKSLRRGDLVRVYSGINGRCCCGCSGTYWTAKQHQDTAGKDRGYPIGDDEINDRQVVRIFNLMKRDEEAVAEVRPGHFQIVIGNRLYMLMTLERMKR